jgi:hypothetical protein
LVGWLGGLDSGDLGCWRLLYDTVGTLVGCHYSFELTFYLGSLSICKYFGLMNADPDFLLPPEAVVWFQYLTSNTDMAFESQQTSL